MRTLIADFIYTFKYFIDFFSVKKVILLFIKCKVHLCRYQKIVIPYGPTGKMVNLPYFRQILLITVWDVKSLL